MTGKQLFCAAVAVQLAVACVCAVIGREWRGAIVILAGRWSTGDGGAGMTPPFDVCRCHADGCEAAQQCRRWVERDVNLGSWTGHSENLNDGTDPNRCNKRIPLAFPPPGA